jgi:hypothetical protein
MWSLLTGAVPNALEAYAGQPLEIVIEILWSFVIGWGLALVLALLVRRIFPDAARWGKWVWLLPVVLLTLGVIADAVQSTPRAALKGFFYYGRDGEDSLGFFLITFPTFSCVIYSLTMYFAERQAARKTPPAQENPSVLPRPM